MLSSLPTPQFSAQLPTDHALVNIDVVFPATEKHIKSAEQPPLHMVRDRLVKSPRLPAPVPYICDILG